MTPKENDLRWIKTADRYPSNLYLTTTKYYPRKGDAPIIDVKALLYHNGSWLNPDTEEPISSKVYVESWMPWPEPDIREDAA